MSKRKMTPGEAVEALRQVAERWPDTLILVQHTDSSSLCVCLRDHEMKWRDDPASLPTYASVPLRITVCS